MAKLTDAQIEMCILDRLLWPSVTNEEIEITLGPGFDLRAKKILAAGQAVHQSDVCRVLKSLRKRGYVAYVDTGHRSVAQVGDRRLMFPIVSIEAKATEREIKERLEQLERDLIPA